MRVHPEGWTLFQYIVPPGIVEEQHVIPNGDLRDHEQSRECWCGPTEDGEQDALWVHNAMDRRECIEEGVALIS